MLCLEDELTAGCILLHLRINSHTVAPVLLSARNCHMHTCHKNAHCITTPSRLLQKREGLKETYFGLLCLQLAARNIDKARFLLHSDFLQRLQLPPLVSHLLPNPSCEHFVDSGGKPVARPCVLGGVPGGLWSSGSASSLTASAAEAGMSTMRRSA